LVYYKAETEKSISDVNAIYKCLVILLNMESVYILAKRKTNLEETWVLKKLNLVLGIRF